MSGRKYTVITLSLVSIAVSMAAVSAVSYVEQAAAQVMPVLPVKDGDSILFHFEECI